MARYNIYYSKYNIIANDYIPYIKVVDVEDIYHEIGKMLCQSLEKIESIRYTKPQASQEDCEKLWVESGYRKLMDDIWILDKRPSDSIPQDEVAENSTVYCEKETLIAFVKQYVPHYNGETTMECVERAIRQAPTAKVVSQKDADNLEYTLMGVMHSVDKWLEGEELNQDEVNRAATMREKTLRIVENSKDEAARKIFEEVNAIFRKYYDACSENSEVKLMELLRQGERFVINEMWHDLNELKKKYPEVLLK